jgi:hypothetical protein
MTERGGLGAKDKGGGKQGSLKRGGGNLERKKKHRQVIFDGQSWRQIIQGRLFQTFLSPPFDGACTLAETKSSKSTIWGQTFWRQNSNSNSEL